MAERETEMVVEEVVEISVEHIVWVELSKALVGLLVFGVLSCAGYVKYKKHRKIIPDELKSNQGQGE